MMRPCLVLVFALAACSTDSGTTPGCVMNVGEDGQAFVAGSCFQFAVCLDESGNLADPETCCMNLSELDRLSCLYGYGAYTPGTPAPDGQGGAGGSTDQGGALGSGGEAAASGGSSAP